MDDYQDQNIWIIGASTGIGKELAISLDQAGAKVILSARNKSQLEELSKQLNHSPTILPLDVSNLKTLQDSVAYLKENNIFPDRIIFMAGIYQPTQIQDMDIAFAKQSIEINLLGAMNVVHAILPWMLEKNSGQIALCGSVAGYCGLPAGQPYSASKAGLINFTETLKLDLSQTNIDVKLINPGFVKTRLTDKNEFDMPFIIEPVQAAEFITTGLLKKSFEIHFPKKFSLMMKWIAALPYGLYFFITRKITA